MSRLVISDPRASWRICTICQHRINPHAGICDEIHLPCSHQGCIPKKDDDAPS